LEKEFYLQKPFSRDLLLRQVSEALTNEPLAHPSAETVNRLPSNLPV
jgi:hypothetical protein